MSCDPNQNHREDVTVVGRGGQWTGGAGEVEADGRERERERVRRGMNTRNRDFKDFKNLGSNQEMSDKNRCSVNNFSL